MSCKAVTAHGTLREPLPPIPIPLSKDDADVILSPTAVFAEVYDRAGYDAAINYDRPIVPPLSADGDRWAAEILAARR